jgi:hypothetical protein
MKEDADADGVPNLDRYSDDPSILTFRSSLEVNRLSARLRGSNVRCAAPVHQKPGGGAFDQWLGLGADGYWRNRVMGGCGILRLGGSRAEHSKAAQDQIDQGQSTPAYPSCFAIEVGAGGNQLLPLTRDLGDGADPSGARQGSFCDIFVQ